MSSDFWWGLACIPMLIGACAIAAAGVVFLFWALAAFGGDKWRVGGEYPPENVAAVMAIRATAYARAVRKVREELNAS